MSGESGDGTKNLENFEYGHLEHMNMLLIGNTMNASCIYKCLERVLEYVLFSFLHCNIIVLFLLNPTLLLGDPNASGEWSFKCRDSNKTL